MMDLLKYISQSELSVSAPVADETTVLANATVSTVAAPTAPEDVSPILFLPPAMFTLATPLVTATSLGLSRAFAPFMSVVQSLRAGVGAFSPHTYAALWAAEGTAILAIEITGTLLAGAFLGYAIVESGAGHYLGLESLGNQLGDAAWGVFGDEPAPPRQVVEGRPEDIPPKHRAIGWMGAGSDCGDIRPGVLGPMCVRW